MCGIAGIVSPVPRPLGQALADMTWAIRHRGPDGEGFLALTPGADAPARASGEIPDVAARVFLGHRRLSIIDVAGSAQPLGNEDGTVWTVFNGEIYNYRELARELEQKGHRLREKGDTEVLVHLWEEHGEAMVERLRGMFAFAVHDARRDTLFLARDRFGEKPLYYWDGPECFAFASELQALKALPGFPLDAVDQTALAQYFRYGYVPGPRTVYRGVRSLGPGQRLVLARGKAAPRAYYVPRVRGQGAGCDVEELGARLDEAVASRLVADVPLGCFLSGGLDSSLVAQAMARSGPVRAFTISTGDPSQDESAVAARIAEHIGAEHHVHAVRPDFAAISETLARHFGQPFADPSAVPTYTVCRETRRRVKVALSGDGGDELFAGYERYANQAASALAARLPGWGRAAAASLLGGLPLRGGLGPALRDFLLSAAPLPDKGENHSALFHRHWRKKAFTPEFEALLAGQGEARAARFRALWAEAGSGLAVERWMEVDQRMYLEGDIFTKVDVASMAVSLETRAPLLDHGFADYANALPLAAKLSGRTGKLALRALAGRRLPAGVAGLPKKGFTIPLARWMRGELREWCRALVLDSRDAWGACLRPEAVRRLWDEHQSGRFDHAMRLWLVACMGLWAVHGAANQQGERRAP